MLFKTTQVEIIVIKFVHLVHNLILYITKPLLLLTQQLCQLFLTLLLIGIQYLPQLCKMLLHFGLNNLPISLLNTLEVKLCLYQLLLSIEYECLHLLNLLLDFPHYLRNHVNLTQGQFLFVNTLCTQQRMLEIFSFLFLHLLNKIGMDELAFMGLAFLI